MNDFVTALGNYSCDWVFVHKSSFEAPGIEQIGFFFENLTYLCIFLKPLFRSFFNKVENHSEQIDKENGEYSYCTKLFKILTCLEARNFS